MPRLLIAGATGLVGRHAVDLALADPRWNGVTALVRRPPPARAGLRSAVVDFERLEATAPADPVDVVCCALGTTMRAAGSPEAFRRVDHDYVVALARLGLDRGARHFLLVSALGADPGSRVFYNRVKGEAERDILGLGYHAVTIARPSLLLGAREESRPLERVFAAVGWLVPPRWGPVKARTVAGALLASATPTASGVLILDNAILRSHRV